MLTPEQEEVLLAIRSEELEVEPRADVDSSDGCHRRTDTATICELVSQLLNVGSRGETEHCDQITITLDTDRSCSVQPNTGAPDTVSVSGMSFAELVDTVNGLVPHSGSLLVVLHDKQSHRTFLCGRGMRLIL